MTPTWDTVEKEIASALSMPPVAARATEEWMDSGWTPRQAMRWIDAGVYHCGEAEDLCDDGVSPQDLEE